MGYFQPLVIYRNPNDKRENSIIRYIGNRVLKKNRNCLVCVSGSTGCLSGDTILYGQTKNLEELYKTGNAFVDTYSLTKIKDKMGTYYPIQSKSQIIPSGIKEVFEIELENGKKVMATSEHKFFKKDGHNIKEVELKDLKVGDELRDFPIDYTKKFYDKANKTSQEKIIKNYCGWKNCIKCNSLIYIHRGIGNKTKKICDSCKKELDSHYHLRKKYNNSWYEWEDNLLRNFYYDKEKEYIINLMPHRTWLAIIHRANRLKIKRNPEMMWKQNAWTSKNNPMYNPHCVKKSKESLRKLYLKHPEKMLNARLKRDSMTLIEKRIAKFLEDNQIKYEWNKYVRTKSTFRFPDFKIGNLIIECDGEYWHKDKQKDFNRQKELEEIGLEVIRFSDKDILKNFEEVKKCIAQKLNQ